MARRSLGWVVGVLGAGMASVCMAGAANASATVGLIWAGSNSTSTLVSTSSTLTLNVVVTAGPGAISSFGISVELADTVGDLQLVGFSNAPNGVSPFSFTLGSTAQNGTQVNNFNAASFSAALVAGESYLAGTLTFHVLPVFDPFSPSVIQGLIVGAPTGTDGVNNGSFLDISGSTTFNPAYVTTFPIPEPATATLLGLGLAAVAAKARSRTH